MSVVEHMVTFYVPAKDSWLNTKLQAKARKAKKIACTLAAGLGLVVFASQAIAQVNVQDIIAPTDIGNQLTATVSIDYVRTSSAPGTATVVLPATLGVSLPLPAGCIFTGPNLVQCAVPAGPAGTEGLIPFNVVGLSVGAYLLQGQGTGQAGNATSNGSVRDSGDLTVAKTRTAPTGTPATGQDITFRLTPSTAGNDIPAGSQIVVTDQLPGGITDFNANSAIVTPSSAATCVINNAARTVSCTFTGPLTAAAFSAATIDITGTSGNSGNFVNNASIATNNNQYFDRVSGNNTATLSFAVTPGADAVPTGSNYPATSLVGANQTLNLVFRNNGPANLPAGGTVKAQIPTGFTVGALPVGCAFAAPTMTCTASAVNNGSSQAFAIPLGNPTTAAAGNITVTVATPAGVTDYNTGNNILLLPFSVVPPTGDLAISKAKTGGPLPEGAAIVNTLSVSNVDISTVTFTAAGGANPLRIIDDMLTQEEFVSASVGWTCSDTPGVPTAAQHRVICERTAAGTLAPSANIALTINTQVATSLGAAPINLSNTACTGKQALNLLGLADANGPQPRDPNTTNDCQSQGVIATPVTTGEAVVNIIKESSNDGINWFDAPASGPTIVGNNEFAYWRIRFATPSTATNGSQQTIPSLVLTDNLPGIFNLAASLPTPAHVTPPITITQVITGNGVAGACPASIGPGSGALSCNFTDMQPGTTVTLVIQVKRPFDAGQLDNTASLSSGNAILSGTVTDGARLIVEPRVDPAVTSKTITPPNSATEPRVGQTVSFTITLRNNGVNPIPAGNMTLTDTLDPTKYAIISTTGANLNCTFVAATGVVTCPTTTAVPRADVRTAVVVARLIKPAGVLTNPVYPNEINTATVTLSGGLCEFKEETNSNALLSTTCNDANSNSNNKSSVTYDIKVPAIDLQTAKSRINPPGGRYAAGDTLKYLIRMQNVGPSRAENVELADYLSVPPGFTVAATTATLVNNAAADAGFTLDTSKNSTVNCSISSTSSLKCLLSTTPAANFLNNGNEVNFVLEVAYTGAAPLAPVTFQNQVVICAAESALYETRGNCTTATQVVNPGDNNNTASTNDTVFPKVDLGIIKSNITGATVTVNQPIVYRLTVRNDGPSPIAQIRVADVLPPGLEYVSSTAELSAFAIGAGTTAITPVCTPTPASITAAGQSQTVSCALDAVGGPFVGSTNSGNTISLLITVKAKAPFFTGPYTTNLTNTASVAVGLDSAGEPLAVDPNPANNTATAVVQVIRTSIAGKVYEDVDFNRQPSAGDVDRPNVPITLTGTDLFGNSITFNATTGPGGTYTFDVPPGSYQILKGTDPVTGLADLTSNIPTKLPFGTTSGPVSAGTPATTAAGSPTSANLLTGIQLQAGDAATNYNFGEVGAGSSIAGKVYVDFNNDGIFVGTDVGIAGVTITLAGTDIFGNSVTRTAVTTGGGEYTFPGLLPGDYTVTEPDQPTTLSGATLPSGFTATFNGVTAVGTGATAGQGVATSPAITPSKITSIKLGINQASVNNNFGELLPSSINGNVFLDTNNDGIQATPDVSLADVTVTLSGLDDLNQVVNITTVTTATGKYAFTGLRPGNYTVTEPQQPPNSVNGITSAGPVPLGTPGTASPVSTTPSSIVSISLPSGTDSPNNNFAEVPLVLISGRVFVDKGYDGLYNPGTDVPLPSNGVTTLTLCLQPNSPCTGTDIVAVTTSTPGSGTYSFPAQPSGRYYVVETQPVGYASSSPNIQTVTLVATPVTDVNFAETGASLSGTVYSDNNANGTLDAPDAGIAGVQMKLCLASSLPLCSTPVSTATTSVGGTYTFADIPAPPAGDSYVVVENETTGILTTYNNGTATAGILTSVGGSGLAAGNVVPAEQGPAFLLDSKINGITFVMPTTVSTGAPPVVGAGYNFGEIPLAGVSGRVFVDRNFTNGTTGTYDPATDGPLLNSGTTTITLCRVDPASAGGVCPATSVEATTSTLADGSYNFPVVPAGNYWVVETQPTGYGSSSPNVVPVTRTGNTAATGINFADTLAEIRGTVYKDDNGSGALNGTEPGIAGVTVKLCLSNDTACATPVKIAITSTPGGTYTFADLPAPPVGQTYFIKEEQSTVPATLQNGTTTVGALAVGGAAAAPVGTANTPGNTINGITWTLSETPVNGLSALGIDYNFGELPTTSISGAVILDKDFSGTQTGGDTGLPTTTTVTLCRSAPAHGSACPPADVVTTTTTTPGSGTYTFPAVTPGTYYVVETQPVGYASSSPNTSAPVLVTTTPITGINFYETGARLSGTVYKDVDYSGTNNAGDIPLPGVIVRVCSTANCAAGSVVATTTTSATGLYQFSDLPAPPAGQTYFIVEDQATVPPTPTVLSDGTTTVGTFALVGTGGTSAPGTAVQTPSRFEGVTWTPPTSVQPAGAPAVAGTNFNFGEIDGFDVGGKVFLDTNRNGGIDSPSDTPLAGILMTLCRVAAVPCPPASIAGTTTTNITGDYTFPRVPPGDYFVQETQPPGYGSVPTPAAPTATDVRPIKVAGANITGINFADTLSSIAGLVYRDDDGSQTRNGAETTMPPGITITLTGVDATGAAVTRTTVTNASGTYVFDNLKTGTYTITETQPADFGNGGANPGTLAGGTGGPNSNRITNIQLPVNTDAPNYNFGDVPKVAGVAGTVWRDNDHDRQRDANEPVLPGWTVQVLRTPVGGGTPTLVASTVSDANGAYSVTGLEAGGGYSVRFIAPGGAIFGGAVDGEQGTPISGASVARGEITNLTLTATVTGAPNIIPQQSLPVDPSGVVYDSDTRLPVPGAQVRFEPVNCPAFDPALHLVGGAANQTQTVGPDGFYQFLLNNGAPACQYRIVVIPPGAYLADPAIPPQAGPFSPPPRPGVSLIVPNATAPQDGQPTTYFLNFNLNPNSQDVVNNHIPLVARVRPVLFVTKVANKSKVELGDTVKYTVKVRYASGTNNLTEVKVVDTMPAGFKLIADTSFVSVPTGAPAVQLAAANITGAPGAVVTYNIPVPGAGLAPGAEVELTYRVRVAVGSMQGDGINRAQARSGVLRSNIAQAKVIVDPGVFTNDGCVAGKVFVDCNNNHIQDAEELGVPNVRMYMEDGTYFITDSEGKYNYCGLSPKSHVITIDMLTMPRGSRLTTTSNRNLGDANSMFLDVKNGQLIRADFAEGSCSNTVLEQVKARRTQGEVRSTETEKKGQPALKWEGKSPQYPQQGTDGANQPLVVPRTTNGGAESAPEQNTPVPQMPGASSNTQGANVRNAK